MYWPCSLSAARRVGVSSNLRLRPPGFPEGCRAASSAEARRPSARPMVASDLRIARTSLLPDRRRVLGKGTSEAERATESYYGATRKRPEPLVSVSPDSGCGLPRSARRGAADQDSFPAVSGRHRLAKDVDVLGGIHLVSRRGLSLQLCKQGPSLRRSLAQLEDAAVRLARVSEGLTPREGDFQNPLPLARVGQSDGLS